MKNVAVIVVWLSCFLLHADEVEDLYRKVVTNSVLTLPRGVPRSVNRNGEVIYVDFMFTTPEYQRAAFNLVIQEANRVVADLGLSESRPITQSNVVHAFISPFGFAYTDKCVGNIKTTNYWYFVKRDYKFSDLTVGNYDDYFVKYRDEKYQVPLSDLNTNAAYQLATQWLTAARVDVPGLNRDGDLHIELSTDLLPDFAESTEKKTRTKISPVYFVWWVFRNEKGGSGNGSLASVELFLPKKQLLQLSVDDSKYNLRAPLVFTNLEALFPGEGRITTYHPSKPKVIDGSGFGP